MFCVCQLSYFKLLLFLFYFLKNIKIQTSACKNRKDICPVVNLHSRHFLFSFIFGDVNRAVIEDHLAKWPPKGTSDHAHRL